MAGGALNICKLNRGDDPREAFNQRFWLAVFSFGIMGAARGIDEGLIAGTLSKTHFIKLLGLDNLGNVELANVKGNITAMVQLGDVGGAALAFILCDRIGRLWATRQLCFLWILGIIIYITNNGRLSQVYAGRFIAGVGIGQTTVVAPVYLAEIAPKSVRGLCTCIFAGSGYIGLMLAYFANWGSELHFQNGSIKQWLVPTMLHIIFAGFIFVLSFFNRESPRYFVKVGRCATATATLARLRGLQMDDEYITREIADIQHQLYEEHRATAGQGCLSVLKEIFCMPSNAYRIYLGLMSQVMSQWSGAQSITIYAPGFFALLGIQGQNEKLLATAVFGVTKFLSAIISAFFLIDVIGRKRSLGIGITLQAVAMAYIAAFLSIVPQLGENTPFTPSQKRASMVAILMIYISGFGWAMGWNSIQYLLSAEIYPLRIRTICTSMVMCFHFANQYGNSRAVPDILLQMADGGLGPGGTFWLFAVITILGGAWAWFFIPETAGRSLESIDRLFMLRWWQIGRHGVAEAEKQERREDKAAEERQTVQQFQMAVKRAVMEVEGDPSHYCRHLPPGTAF